MSLGFGTAARIGHLYPSGGLCDYEIQLMAPPGVQFLTTRLPFTRTGLEADHEILADLETHARLLADAEVSLIAMNCTAAGMVAGPETVNGRIRDATGTPPARLRSPPSRRSRPPWPRSGLGASRC